MLTCIIFVASALFEDAILVTIRVGKQNKVHGSTIGIDDEATVVGRCRKIDLYAMRVFLVLHAAVICAYFSFITFIPKIASHYAISHL